MKPLRQTPEEPLAGRFLGTRARFQRLSDAKLFYGWVRHVTEERVVLEIDGAPALAVGDKFHFDLIGFANRALFQTSLVSQSSGIYTFRIETKPQFAAASESARISLKPTEAEVEWSGEPMTGTMLDASPGGIGLALPQPTNVGEELVVRFELDGKKLEARVAVRYSRPLPNSETFRTGVRILDMNRIDRGRWMRQFEDHD